MREVLRTIQLAAASAVNIAGAQIPAAGVPMVLTPAALAGTVPDVARRILITYGVEAVARVLVIVGLNHGLQPITESVAIPSGGAGAVATVQDFRRVISMTSAVAFSGAITVGTNGVASTAWVMLDQMVSPQDVGLGVMLRGVTANVTVEVTQDNLQTKQLQDRPVPMGENPWATPAPVLFSGAEVTQPTMAAIVADTIGELLKPCAAVRMTVNSGAITGPIDFMVRQQGLWG